MTTRRPLSSPSSSPPSKRQRLSSPIYDQQAGNITSEDLEAFDRFEASQSSNADFRNDPENPFAAGAAGFTSASKLHTTRPASPGDRRSSSPPPPEPDYDAWFAPATGVPTMVTFQTARTAATAAPSATFGKASGVGVFQPSSAALAKAKEKMSVWTETTTTTSQSGVENLFKSAASLPRVASPERPIRTLGNATNSPSTPSPAEGFRSASMALSTQSTPSIALSNNKRFKAPTFVNSPLNPNARRPESTLNHMLSTPLRTPYRSAQPLPSSSAVRTKPAFKTPFKAGMKPGQVGHAALLTKQTPVQTTPLKTPTSALPAPTRTVKQFFDLKPPPERKTLRSSGRTPQEYTAADLTQYGVNVAELERITPSIAAYYSFHTTTPELLTELPFTPSKAFGTAAALEELLARGCSLATKRWVDNHWCLILWKLAGMVCLEPELEKDPRTKRWCWEEVMRQLFYRYERELNCGVRPPLRNIATQDAPASCPIVLCVSNITWLDGGMSDDGVALPAHPELEVTDGWYRLRAQVDAPLARAIRRGVIRIGRKVGVVGAQLSNERKEPQEVLEAYNSTKLQFVGNCTHLVPWHTKLGFQTSPWIATMRSLTADGGLVPALDVVLLKVYPVAYIEFIEEDGQKRREGPRSAKEEAQEEEHWKRRREVHESKLREAMDKKEMRYRGYAERLERKAGRSITSGEDEPPDEIDDLYDQLEEADEAAQVLSHISAVNAGWLARCIMNRLEKERERGADEIEQELKTSCPPREVRNFRVIFVQDAVTVRRTSSRTAQLTIWDALKYPAMNVGERYQVTNLRPTSLSAWMAPDEAGSEILLSTTQRSIWKRG